MTHNRLRLIITFLILLSSDLRAADHQVEDYVHSLLNSQHVPGAALAVVREGQVVEEITFGKANLQLNVPVDRSTVFQLASVTKVFTAQAVMILEREGKLRLDDPVSNYLTDLPPTWEGVTIRELATHTSGLPDVIADPNKPLSSDELTRNSETALKLAATRPVVAPPGSQFQYDQTNYVLLKRVVERVSGVTFRNFVTSQVLGANMPHTSWGDSRVIVSGRTDMYTELYNNRIENGANLYQYPDYLEAAAGLNSYISDMEVFGKTLTVDGVLGPNELKDMWKPATSRAGALIDLAKDMEVTGQVAPASGWFYADNSQGQYPRSL